MRRAFAKGYDPVLELAEAATKDADGNPKLGRVQRKEQEYITKIINGEITGEYLLLMGPKVGFFSGARAVDRAEERGS